MAQYNYILVVGAEEAAANTVNVRTRDNQVRAALSCVLSAVGGARAGGRWLGLPLLPCSVRRPAWRPAARRCLPRGATQPDLNHPCILSRPAHPKPTPAAFIPRLQVHGMHTLANVQEVMTRERDTRSAVSLFGEGKEAAAAAPAAADGQT